MAVCIIELTAVSTNQSDARVSHNVHEHTMLVLLQEGGVEVWGREGRPRTIRCVEV